MTSSTSRGQLSGRGKQSSATVRVAIYTRKSVSEGLDQEFNTLDAQREAVKAYVQSQRGEGWAALPESYDDGGYTGANTDRPAFQRLLVDIEAGKVDAVAVYKLDRLSRSLLDFAHLMEILQARGVAFVSVTEHFETSSPMGRMVLNMLATFAQFERETIAQRTSDKMLASRRRGMWTGGRPVLGYDVVEKRLVVNEDEADRVRAIFELYLDLGSLLAVVDELRRQAWTTKIWTTKEGKLHHGRPFTKGSLRGLLTNPLYAGRVRAGEEVVEGLHEAVVGEATWRAVQQKLLDNAGRRGRSGRRKHDALLAGLVRCGACGAGMTTHYTKKGDRRYAYYVCQTVQKAGASACPGSRVAAGELEAFVVDQLREVGRDPAVLDATLAADRSGRDARRPELEAEARRLASKQGRLKAERENLVDAVAKGDGNASHVLLERVEALDEEVAGAGQRIEAVSGELAALELGAIDGDELRTALEDLEPIWGELFPKERVRVLALLLESVEFNGAEGEVVLTFRPGAPRGLAGEAWS